MVRSRDDPLFVWWVAFICTPNIRACVYTGDPAAARWAVVGNIDCVTDADKMLRATDEVFRYVMYAPGRTGAAAATTTRGSRPQIPVTCARCA
jgi:hypothetical protein